MATPQVIKLHTLSGHNDCIYTLQSARVSNQFFSGAGDGMVVLWDLVKPTDGQLIAKLENSVYALHHLAETNQLIVGHNYDGIHLIDWKNRVETGSLNFTTAAIFDIVSYGNIIFVATADGVVYAIDHHKLRIVNSVKLSDKSARTLAINTKSGELAVGYLLE